jgi:hypothetical protein
VSLRPWTGIDLPFVTSAIWEASISHLSLLIRDWKGFDIAFVTPTMGGTNPTMGGINPPSVHTYIWEKTYLPSITLTLGKNLISHMSLLLWKKLTSHLPLLPWEGRNVRSYHSHILGGNRLAFVTPVLKGIDRPPANPASGRNEARLSLLL